MIKLKSSISIKKIKYLQGVKNLRKIVSKNDQLNVELNKKTDHSIVRTNFKNV